MLTISRELVSNNVIMNRIKIYFVMVEGKQGGCVAYSVDVRGL